MSNTVSVNVAKLYRDKKEELALNLVAGKDGLRNPIHNVEPNRPGLLLAGYSKDFPAERVQILGNREIGYLNQLSTEERKKAIKLLSSFKIPAIIVTHSLSLPTYLKIECKKRKIPLFKTEKASVEVASSIHQYLEDKLAPFMTIHGSLMDIYGAGILFTGESGIGKSETSLDLVDRGHRLIADDIVRIKRVGNILIGEGVEKSHSIKHFMEIRGIGFLDIAMMFGIRGIRLHKRIEVEISLSHWKRNQDYARTGLEERDTEILGVEIPIVKIPVVPGRNIAILAEAVALNHLLKIRGYDTARYLDYEIKKIMEQEAKRVAKLDEDRE